METHRGCCLCASSKTWPLFHVMSINMSGKTVLVFGGAMIALDASVHTGLRVICATNAIFMLLGQMWYTSYWTKEGIEAFVLRQRDQHALLRLGSSSFILGCAALYYVAFAILFGWASMLQHPLRGMEYRYALVASGWHAWVSVFLIYASAQR